MHNIRILFLFSLLIAFEVGCSCNQPYRRFDMQKELTSMGVVGARKLTLNPAMLTPFLDESNSEESALKFFLNSIEDVNVYNVPTRLVLDDLAAHAQEADYALEMDVIQGPHRMWVYICPAKSEKITGLLLFLVEPNDTFYSIEMHGVVNKMTLAKLNQVSPAFVDQYIKRFNIQF